MPYPQKMLIFVCTILSGCAAGVMGDEMIDPSSSLVAEPVSSAASVIEAGAPAASDVVSGAAQSPIVPVVVVPSASSGGDAGAATAPATGSTSPLDAGLPVSTPPEASVPEASLPSVTLDAASTRDSAAASTTDAAREASTPPPSAPSCDPAKCDNECLLLPRCCNAQNQCACFSVLRGTCSLSSID